MQSQTDAYANEGCSRHKFSKEPPPWKLSTATRRNAQYIKAPPGTLVLQYFATVNRCITTTGPPNSTDTSYSTMQGLALFSLIVAGLCLMELPLIKAEFTEDNAQTAPNESNFISHFARSPTVPCRHHYRELANYLLELAKEAMAKANDSQPCERKRNSELINSLLGLPKVMNDAGK